MSDARSVVLGRIREALGASPAAPEVPRDYHGAHAEADVGLFCERVADYRATVRRISAEALDGTLAEICAGRRLGVPPGVAWRPSGADVVVDDPPLAARDLDTLDGALTGCALAIAETGTIVLDGGERSGRRALSLVPDLHVCVVEAGQVVADLPGAIARLAEAARDGCPVTFVSGPSATSDIELQRVEGVHGPRQLVVLVLV